MGLEQFTNDSDNEGDAEQVDSNSICPACDKQGEHVRGKEWKCTTDSDECEVITWRNNEYELKHATM